MSSSQKHGMADDWLCGDLLKSNHNNKIILLLEINKNTILVLKMAINPKMQKLARKISFWNQFKEQL